MNDHADDDVWVDAAMVSWPFSFALRFASCDMILGGGERKEDSSVGTGLEDGPQVEGSRRWDADTVDQSTTVSVEVSDSPTWEEAVL